LCAVNKSAEYALRTHNEYVSAIVEGRARRIETRLDLPVARPWFRGGRSFPGFAFSEFVFAVVIVGISTLAALALRPHVSATNLAMVYLVGVVAIAMRCGQQISVLSSFLSVAAFDFFCVPPYLTLRVTDYADLITFAGMLVVALVVSTQTARTRIQAADAVEREARTEALYRLSRRLAGQTQVLDVARTAAECAEEVFEAHVVIFLPDEGSINARHAVGHLPVSPAEEAVAQWVHAHGEKAGKGMKTLPGVRGLYLPLKGAREIVGVLGFFPIAENGVLAAGQMQLLEVFTAQTALAIERTGSQHLAEAARIRMQTEEMRSTLLSAVSHDLRTPLASITGAASTLRSQGNRLQPEIREDLLQSIEDEAERLGRLVGNLLEMTRLESGVELRRELYPIEEIVGAALQRMEHQLGKRQVRTNLPDSLPLVYVDDVLFGQVIVNLLENAIKYTPEGTAIEIEAIADPDAVTLEVRDCGGGFAPGEELRVFEKFYRGKSEGVRGAGLGLAICQAIMEAHRGAIEAFNRVDGGAVFRIRVPMAEL
jgi:two-component system, OmpR family, sensor histidine kinase KdpD